MSERFSYLVRGGVRESPEGRRLLPVTGQSSITERYVHAAQVAFPGAAERAEELLFARVMHAVGSVGPATAGLVRKEKNVSRMVLTHAVADVERWLDGKAERAAAIESGSGSNVTDYVAADGTNNIAVTADVADVDAMKAMLASPPPEVLERMEAHGVVPPITAYIEA